jgi:D-alanyl-lipoteichoic acid acyltransferase DltB (MBOAT superfamily)
MLFNSYIFILAFLPVTIIGFFTIGRFGHQYSIGWLALASLFFYAWWDFRYVGLLVCSIIINFGFGVLIGRHLSDEQSRTAKWLTVIAIGANLLLLGYYKYANFFAKNVNQFASWNIEFESVILPLGISFFTFTQIAYLMDTFQGKVKEFSFNNYLLFVTYFPHLIAGPLLHHKYMMPQFASKRNNIIDWNNISVGGTIFVFGLAKKVLIADSIAGYSTPIFNAVESGGIPLLVESWLGALAYTLQLYFDFSAYSDMAIGLSLMFNVRLPLNFNSPYKATSIIDFWRRWHISLSAFLRDYLYIPLGGSAFGEFRRTVNLMVTMLIGGLWHGAGWTFVLWGGLHGLYLVLNHTWRRLFGHTEGAPGTRLGEIVAGAVTFLAVVVGWVVFRADSISSAMVILRGMAGLNGISLPILFEPWATNNISSVIGIKFLGLNPLVPEINIIEGIKVLLLGFTIVWFFPNVHQIFIAYRPTCEDIRSTSNALTSAKKGSNRRLWSFNSLVWAPNYWFAWFTGALFCFSIMELTSVSEFLYFQF